MMNKVIRNTLFFFLITAIFFLFTGCGGVEQIVLSIPGKEPTLELFIETLGVSEQDAEKLLEEVAAMKDDFLFLSGDSIDVRAALNNGVDSQYIGELSFGPYPCFSQYHLSAAYFGLKQIYIINNSQGECRVKTYVSVNDLGESPTEESITNNGALLFTLSVTSDGTKEVIFNSQNSEGAKKVLSAINDSIDKKEKVSLYLYKITYSDNFDDQITIGVQEPVVSLKVDLNLDKPNEKPVIEKISGPEGDTSSPESIFNWRGSDPDGSIKQYTISKDGVTETTDATGASWSDYSEGQHTFTVKALDNRQGESNELVWSFSYTQNQSPVILKVSGPESQIDENNATFEWSGSDAQEARVIQKYQFKKDSGDWTDINPQTATVYHWTDIPEGTHTFYVKAYDETDLPSNILSWHFNYHVEKSDEKYLATVGYGGLKIFDISKESELLPVGEFSDTSQGYSMAYADDIIYYSRGSSGGIKMIDISDRSNPADTGKTYLSTGRPNEIQLMGDYLYVADYYKGLTIIDLKNESVIYQGNKSYYDRLHISGNYAYLAGYYGFYIYDVSNPGHPIEVAEQSIPGSGRSEAIYAAGNRLYVGTSDANLFIFDISTPAAPELLNPAGYDCDDTPYKIFVEGVYAYIGSNNSVLVLDVSDPPGIHMKGSVLTDFVYGLDKDQQSLFCSTNDGIISIDLNTYSEKVRYDSSAYRDIQIIPGNSVYNSQPNDLTNRWPENGQEGIELSPAIRWQGKDPDGDPLRYDVYFGESANPPKVSSGQDNNSYGTGLLNKNTTYYWKVTTKDGNENQSVSPIYSFKTVNKNNPEYGLLVGDEGLLVMDISDPDHPFIHGRNGESEGYAVVYKDHLAYVSTAGSEGILIVDLHDKANPVIRGRYSTDYYSTSDPYGLQIVGDYLYVADQNNGLIIIDLLNEAMIGSGGQKSSYEFIHVFGDYAYLGGYYHFYCYDISDPSDPIEVSETDIPGSEYTQAVYALGDRLYVGSSDDKLYIYDVSSPAAPELLNPDGYDCGSVPYDIYVEGRYAYIATYKGVRVIDISNPTNISSKGTVNANYLYGIDKTDDYIYAAGQRFSTIPISDTHYISYANEAVYLPESDFTDFLVIDYEKTLPIYDHELVIQVKQRDDLPISEQDRNDIRVLLYDIETHEKIADLLCTEVSDKIVQAQTTIESGQYRYEVVRAADEGESIFESESWDQGTLAVYIDKTITLYRENPVSVSLYPNEESLVGKETPITPKINVSNGDTSLDVKAEFVFDATPDATDLANADCETTIVTVGRDTGKQLRASRDVTLSGNEHMYVILKAKIQGTWKVVDTCTWFELEFLSETVGEVVYRALLFGIEDYDGNNDLDYTFDDILDIEQVMNHQNHTYQIEKMGDTQQVTREQMLAKLDEYANDPSIDANDVFFLGYSGHGGYTEGTSWLVSSDLWGISVAEIRGKLDAIPGTKIVSIDACMSGDFVNLSGARTSRDDDIQARGKRFIQGIVDSFESKQDERGAFVTEYEYYVMASSDIDEYSWESLSIENGFYSFFLADGAGHAGLDNAKGEFDFTYDADVNEDQLITLSELYDYVSTNVYALTESQQVQTVQVYPEHSEYVLFEY